MSSEELQIKLKQIQTDLNVANKKASDAKEKAELLAKQAKEAEEAASAAEKKSKDLFRELKIIEKQIAVNKAKKATEDAKKAAEDAKKAEEDAEKALAQELAKTSPNVWNNGPPANTGHSNSNTKVMSRNTKIGSKEKTIEIGSKEITTEIGFYHFKHFEKAVNQAKKKGIRFFSEIKGKKRKNFATLRLDQLEFFLGLFKKHGYTYPLVPNLINNGTISKGDIQNLFPNLEKRSFYLRLNQSDFDDFQDIMKEIVISFDVIDKETVTLIHPNQVERFDSELEKWGIRVVE